MWLEMSYNKYRQNSSLSQRLEEEVEDDLKYIGDNNEFEQTDISLFDCD